MIGPQDEDSLSHLENQGQLNYCRKLQASSTKKLEIKFRKSNPEIVQMLGELLEFNPHKRPSAKECLQKKLFDDIRVPMLEKGAPCTIDLSQIDGEGQFDYKNWKDTKLSITDLKNMLLKILE